MRHVNDFPCWSSVCGLNGMDGMETREEEGKEKHSKSSLVLWVWRMSLGFHVQRHHLKGLYVLFVRNTCIQTDGAHTRINRSLCTAATLSITNAVVSGLSGKKGATANQAAQYVEQQVIQWICSREASNGGPQHLGREAGSEAMKRAIVEMCSRHVAVMWL
mmetsp:Transcript_121479/g.288710  ORF Transcript_121479/g.288710 Transcript_121479/m.288710 type:complete len:161 (+) Transcript_121479:898-1380(+)